VYPEHYFNLRDGVGRLDSRAGGLGTIR